MGTSIQHLGVAACVFVLGAVPVRGQIVKCTPYVQGAGYGPQDVTKCSDVGDCGPSGTSCCLRYTCVGHPPACGQNCGQACSFAFSCADLEGSDVCFSDCGLDSISRRPRRTGANAAIKRVSYQPPQSTSPFTLVREVVSFQHSMKGEVHRHETIAVRSDGSRSVTTTILGSVGMSRSELKRSISFADGRLVTQFLALGVKTTWPSLDEAKIAERRARSQAIEAAGCLIPGWARGGVDTILQHPVTILSHTSDDIGWRLTIWDAPQLGCEDLRQLSYDRQPDGSYALTTETRTVSLSTGEPDASLFGEPPGLREAAPLEVGQLLARKYGLPLNTEQLRDLMRLFDSSYSRRQ